jgi:hypothetical protein
MRFPEQEHSSATRGARELEELRGDARYSRERVDLYRAKAYSGRLTTPARLRELERAAEAAEARLKHAEQQSH